MVGKRVGEVGRTVMLVSKRTVRAQCEDSAMEIRFRIGNRVNGISVRIGIIQQDTVIIGIAVQSQQIIDDQSLANL